MRDVQIHDGNHGPMRILATLLLAAAPVLVHAGVPILATTATAPHALADEAEFREQLRASMVVTGSIDIEPDGTVSALSLDQQEKLPGPVVDVTRKSVAQWRFEPVLVDGVASRARVLVTLRVVAAPAGDGAIGISLANATFMHRKTDDRREHLRLFRYTPPRYPPFALDRNASGNVILLLKINRQGLVVEGAVEQVNLHAIGNARTVRLLRKFFGESAMDAARYWNFKTPTVGPDSEGPYWTARIPVSFVLDESSDPTPYGQWVGYLPGPVQVASWLEKAAPDASDSGANGSIQLVGSGPRLLTPLQPQG